MKHRLVICAISLFSMACGYEKKINEMILNVEALGVLKASPNAQGNTAPQSVEVSIAAISFVDGEGEDLHILQNATPPTRVVDRPQIIHSENLKPHRGKKFSAAVVTLNPTITMYGKYVIEDMNLENPEVRLDEPIHFSPGKGLRLILEVHWYKSVDRDDTIMEEDFYLPIMRIKQRAQ